MNSTVEAIRPDTHEMVVVHRAFRREFRVTADLIRAVTPGDVARASVLTEHLTDLVWVLHHHHHGEDELLWPKLLVRAKPDTGLVQLMEAQHERVSAALDGIDAVIPKWKAAAEAGSAAALAETIDQMRSALEEHLDQEEAEILPLVQQHLSVSEWRQLGKSAVDSLPKSKRLTFLGMILEDTSDDERARFLDNLPPPVRVLWRVLGARSYARYVGKIRYAAT